MLSKKMRITENSSLAVINPPPAYKRKLGPLPQGVKIREKLNKNEEFVHLFVKNKKELEKYFPKVRKVLSDGGLLWISYPKGSSGMQTDLTRDQGWETIANSNMQWLSLISFDDKWSAFLMKNSLPKTKNKLSEEYHSNKETWSDAKTKTVKVPDELSAAFKKNKKAEKTFEALNFTGRKEFVMWIVSAKRVETRAERAKKTIEKLLTGKKTPMEK